MFHEAAECLGLRVCKVVHVLWFMKGAEIDYFLFGIHGLTFYRDSSIWCYRAVWYVTKNTPVGFLNRNDIFVLKLIFCSFDLSRDQTDQKSWGSNFPAPPLFLTR